MTTAARSEPKYPFGESAQPRTTGWRNLRHRRLHLEQLEDRNLLANWALASVGPISEQVADVATDASGNIYVLGEISDVVQVGTISAGEVGTRSAIVAKLDFGGNVLWVNRIGTESSAGHIALDASGNIFVSGAIYLKKYDPDWNLMASASVAGDIALDDSGNVFLASGTTSVTAIIKLDANTLDQLWVRTISGGTPVGGIALDTAGNPVVAGQFSGTVDFDPATGKGNNYSLFSGGRKVQPSLAAFVWKLDTAGNFLWARHFQADIWGFSIARGIAIDADNNVYTVGDFGGKVDFNPGSGSLQLSNAGNTDVFLSKLDSSGNYVWARSMGGTSQDYGNGIALDSAGSVYLTGSFESGVFYPGTSTVSLQNRGGEDVFVCKVSSSGSYSWVGQLGGSGQDYAKAIALLGQNNVVAAGNFTGVAAGSDFDPGSEVIPLDSGSGGYDAMFFSGFSWAAALHAASMGMNHQLQPPLTSMEVTPILAASLDRWLAAGESTAALANISVRIADLGGTTLGVAVGRTIWLDDNAAGWGWFVDSTPSDDSEFAMPGKRGEQNRVDLLTVVMHEVGHLLGHDHVQEGVMSDTLVAGVRATRPEHDLLTDQVLEQPDDYRMDSWLGRLKITKRSSSWRRSPREC